VADTDRRRQPQLGEAHDDYGQVSRRDNTGGCDKGVADTNGKGLQGAEQRKAPCETRGASQPTAQRGSPAWECWSLEPDVGRVAHGVPKRVDRLKSLGNAIVPQCALYVFNHVLGGDNDATAS
jgi:DNA (cytosine-5)-methyltransferase 1